MKSELTPPSWSAWDDVLRLHRAHGRPAERHRAALLVAEPPIASPQPWRLALDSVVVLGWSRQGTAPAAPRVRAARRRGGSAVTVLGALIDVLVESPDTYVVVVTPRSAARDAPVDRAVQRALVAAEADPEAVVVVTGAIAGSKTEARDAAWLIPTGSGIVRPAAVVPHPRDGATAKHMRARGAVRDLGIAVAHGKALFDVFAAAHPLLVRMFTYAAELSPEQREPYLASACRDLEAPTWSAALFGGCSRLRVVKAEPVETSRHATGPLTAEAPSRLPDASDG
jgi:hypothetical protein